MALQKTITLCNGSIGNYIKISDYRRSINVKEVSVHFTLYTDKAASEAKPQFPLGFLGKLRLSGAKYDLYLGRDSANVDVRTHFYGAAKVEKLIGDPGAGGGALDLSDAVDV